MTDLSQPLEVVTALERKKRRGNVTNVIWVRTVEAVTHSIFLIPSFSTELFHHFLPSSKMLSLFQAGFTKLAGLLVYNSPLSLFQKHEYAISVAVVSLAY